MHLAFSTFILFGKDRGIDGARFWDNATYKRVVGFLYLACFKSVDNL